MGFLSYVFGKDPELKTQTVVDKKKEAVANPLSRYLSSNIGDGVPRYPDQILSDLPEGGGASISNFLKTDAESFFNERIKDPALETFRKDLLPVIRESFAGRLSSSGRYRSEEESASALTRGLAQTRAKLELDLPQRQLQVASGVKEQIDKERLLQYNDWLKSLPQYNPVLKQAIGFLSEGTSSGETVLSYIDPGQQGLLKDLLGQFAEGAGKAAAAGAGGGG